MDQQNYNEFIEQLSNVLNVAITEGFDTSELHGKLFDAGGETDPVQRSYNQISAVHDFLVNETKNNPAVEMAYMLARAEYTDLIATPQAAAPQEVVPQSKMSMPAP